MAEADNVVLEHLRHIRSTVDGLRDDMREVKGRLGILESQYANLSNRLDRLDGRVERIEQRSTGELEVRGVDRRLAVRALVATELTPGPDQIIEQPLEELASSVIGAEKRVTPFARWAPATLSNTLMPRPPTMSASACVIACCCLVGSEGGGGACGTIPSSRT